MTLFNRIVLKCPQCGGLMGDFELVSYTIHGGGISWTDGKSDQDMFGSKEIKICLVCHLPFWRENSKLPYDADWDVADELGDAMDIIDLEWRFDDDYEEKAIAFYEDMLDRGYGYDNKTEAYLRTRIWWSINDIIRELPSLINARNFGQISEIINMRKNRNALFEKYEDLQTTNLKRLMYFYIQDDNVDLLYLANMYRECADFKKAKEIIGKVKEGKGKTYRLIKRKIKAKDRRVFKCSW